MRTWMMPRLLTDCQSPIIGRAAWGKGLHSAAAIVLAETLGSCGAHYATAPNLRAVGMSINAGKQAGTRVSAGSRCDLPWRALRPRCA